LNEVLAVEVHIHTRSHPADKVEYRIVEEEWQKGLAEVVRHKGSEEEHRRDSVECHILNMDLLHLAVVPVLHKGFVEHYYLDQVLPHHSLVALVLRCQVAPGLELDPKPWKFSFTGSITIRNFFQILA